ncbi:MAG: hypothetical protein A3J48_02860 [Candidatus Doudnabacteria bacterium RIFCSPHIGHO2_02_FULL_46_11]|uniref:Triosephosphate isomerase n=1 Tax=Candidatus Doudnabacteria bacterium RIFCSPHIGHO2_02_FULL_46_11 TaxID=1817832 RepID=A0A1F5P626_9BACT|nr:MAG: hypothetical protein A3J48_02860 [Candidatus Doudnabacteria bacterium RIFCSPHIGHO2_02_FULL_46_11]
MHPDSADEAAQLAHSVEQGLLGVENLEIVLCPPFPYLNAVKEATDKIHLGAQDVSAFEPGAYTGQVSANQLKNLSVSHCIVGHSERRNFAHETEEDISKKIDRCLETGIIPVVCLGSGLKPDDSDATIKSVLRKQFQAYLHGKSFGALLLTYEPTWAISSSGSGRVPTGKHVKEMADFLKELISEEHISEYSILYGGSVNSRDVTNFPGVDGYLVGAASLNGEEFIALGRAISNFQFLNNY